MAAGVMLFSKLFNVAAICGKSPRSFDCLHYVSDAFATGQVLRIPGTLSTVTAGSATAASQNGDIRHLASSRVPTTDIATTDR